MIKNKNKSFKGKVILGERVGRTIGFPTANIDNVPSEDDLDVGVYSGECLLKNEKYKCLVYFGPRFIFNEVENVFEIFIIDFNAKIYGSEIIVIVQEFIRPPAKPTSLNELKKQLTDDLNKVKEIHARTS